jgi:RNA polymerase sigma-70 factor (ECF subfamily)
MAFVRFPSTVWNILHKAKQKDPAALEDILHRYRPPLVQFALQWGLQAADAEDAAQEAFARVLAQDLIEAADPSKGKFRSLLLAVIRNVILEKRRHEARQSQLKSKTAEQDPEFDRAWALNLLRLAMERLKEECTGKRAPYYEALCLLTREGLSYADIARRLGKTETEVTNYIHRAKTMVRKHFADCIRDYASSEEEFRAEQQYLSGFF